MTTTLSNKPITSYVDPIQYRVIFISPFFEIEVSNGWQRWQTVRSQDRVQRDRASGYPVLQFPSHGAAVAYAEDSLGLSARKPSLFRRIWRRLSTPSSSSWEQQHEVQVEQPVSSAPLSVVHGAVSPQANLG